MFEEIILQFVGFFSGIAVGAILREMAEYDSLGH